MAREGLFDDTGYHGFDEAEIMAEKYCSRCINQPTATDAAGQEYVIDCDKDCLLCDPKYFMEEGEE